MQAVHEIKSSECALITLQRGHGGNATFYVCIMSMHDTTCTYIGSVKFCKTSTIYRVHLVTAVVNYCKKYGKADSCLTKANLTTHTLVQLVSVTFFVKCLS
jgi:hypothetical protein